MPKSKIQCNDFFVCCIDPALHRKIHGEKSVQWYIDSVGIENLLADSAIMFAKWLGELGTMYHPHFDRYVKMIREIHEDPGNFEHVLSATRRCAEDIHLGGD
jgi:hypothetical protein